MIDSETAFMTGVKFVRGCVRVSGSLVDKKGKILVPGMYDDVAELTDAEKKLYEKIEFDLDEYTKDVGAQRLLHSTKVNFSVSVLCVVTWLQCFHDRCLYVVTLYLNENVIENVV